MLDETLPLTPPEWPEWGDPNRNAAAFRTILAYSPCENVRPQSYPAILALAGLTDPRVLCFPKIISERNGDAGQTRLGWLQRPRSVALPDLEAHLCLAPSACGPHCSTPHTNKEFVAGAPRTTAVGAGRGPAPKTRTIAQKSGSEPQTDQWPQSPARG